jgi:sulfatase modifying factor 1
VIIDLSPNEAGGAVPSAPEVVPPSGMVIIPAGPFQMGDDAGGDFERPEHAVEISAYWLDQTPTTNAEFARFAAATGYVTAAERAREAWGYADGRFTAVPGLSWRSFAGLDRQDHPVVLVDWNDANAFALWASKRLPTEAEWEKAARGGLVGRLYPWGNDTPDRSQSNFARRAGLVPPTTPVKKYPSNGFGLFDMVGNVWQWCSDYYADSYLAHGPRHNPSGPIAGTHRVRRGGSWNVIQPFRLRCANRGAITPKAAYPNIGFRCARTAM